MGTRSIIVVTGNSRAGGASTTRLYKGYDGYPTDVLSVIGDALKKANKQVKEQNEKWGENTNFINQSQMVGLIIGESTGIYGQGAVVDKTYYKPFDKRHLGNQWDLEWVYIVNTDAKTIEVFGGGCAVPKDHLAQGYTDPVSYAEYLREEFIEEEKKEIKSLVKTIEKEGFTVNKKPALELVDS